MIAPHLAVALREVAEMEWRAGMKLENLGMKQAAAVRFLAAAAYHATALKLEVSR